MRKKTDNSPKSAKVDGRCDATYHLAVEIEVSDNRRRDLDGALSTLLDCCTAARRQLQNNYEDISAGKEGSEG